MKTNALFIAAGIVGMLVLLILAYGLEISHLIFDFKWKKRIKSFWKKSQRFFQSLVRTRMKKIKGKIIRLKAKKFPIIMDYNLDNNTTLIQNLIYAKENPAEVIGYFVFFEESKKHQKSFIEISRESYEELKKRDISSLKHTSLLFEMWFWGKNYHHYEIA